MADVRLHVTTDPESDWRIPRRTYTIYVCTVCGSDNIMSNDEGSYCNECREWMSSTLLEVVPSES